MTSIIAAVVVLGGLIFAHELGHFIVARLCGVRVNTFSLGFGPRIFGFRRGETDYRVSIVPLGGYVRMLGEHPDDQVAEEDQPFSFSHQSVWRRFLIVLAGPTANFVLAIVVFSFILGAWGEPVLKPTVGKVLDGYPAQTIGMKPGDVIVSINGEPVAEWRLMAERIRKYGHRPITVAWERDGKIMSRTVKTVTGTGKDIFGQTTSNPMLGVSPSGETFIRRPGPGGALVGGLKQTWDVVELTIMSVVKIFQRQISMDTIGGPIFIAQAAGEQAKAGPANLLFFAALLSVNLGILNLLPIPVLDGGHLFFFTIEAIIRRPVPIKARERAQQFGVAVLLTLMAVVFYNDIARIVTGYMGSQ